MTQGQMPRGSQEPLDTAYDVGLLDLDGVVYLGGTAIPGAAEALRKKGRSLLPSGIREVAGEFSSGDCVSLLDHEGVEFGRGLVNYPAADILKLKGRRSNDISRVLGYKVADEVIHRDNFALMEELA